MRKVIHHLRKQPEEMRRHILHLTMLAFAVILVTLWVYSLSSHFSNANTKYEIKESIKPIQDFSEDLGADINSL